jgi:NitT/TauT family transport system substrate-binding protein
MRKLSFYGAVSAAVLAAGALTGCSAANGTADAATSQIEQTSITVDSVPVAEEAGLYVAQQQGFFARAGLNVKIDSITGGEAAVPDLQSGRAQLVAGNYVSFILAQEAGQFNRQPVSLRIVAAGSEITPGTEDLYVMPHSKFQTVSELARRHARIGLNTANDIGDLMVGATLEQAGYKLSDINQVIPAGGFPALLKMLPAGQVDAAWLPQPLGEIAEQQIGAVPIADFDQGSLQDFPFTGYIGNAAWVRTHPGTVAAFLRALNEGQQLANTDRPAVEKAAEKYLGISPLVAATMAIDSYPLEIDVPQLQRVADSMYEFRLTPGRYDISRMIQPEPGLIGG